MKTKLIIILLASLLGCDQCEPDPPLTELEKLPPATQEGKNTFGCLVNGKAWVTKTSIDTRAFYQGGIFSVSAKLVNPQFYQGISFTIVDRSLGVREYHLTEFPGALAQLGDYRTGCGFQTSTTSSGRLTLTNVDRLNYIVSGTFEFEAISPTCGTIIVAEGRFDLTYAP